MRILLQRVSRARVIVDGSTVGEIGPGFVLLVGTTHDDVEADASFLAAKVANLRVFDDGAGNINRSALDIAAESPKDARMLVVSQFTLYADARKGRRPSFARAAPAEIAAPLIDHFTAELRALGLSVAEGRFGAKMAVELVNDGPVTIWLDTSELKAR